MQSLPCTLGVFDKKFIALLNRFWVKVKITEHGCWEWQGANTAGYGAFAVPYRSGMLAHRLVAQLFYGPIPEGLFVLHSCDNRACCRPDHLRLGTQQENVDDCGERGRRPRGTEKPNTRLHESDIPEIRRRLASGEGRSPIARSYGVDPQTIRQIETGKTWGHVQDGS